MSRRTDPGTEARVLVMKGEGMSMQAIADELGISKSVVRNIINRACRESSADNPVARARATDKEPVPVSFKQARTQARQQAQEQAREGTPTKPLTKERTVREINILLQIAQQGFVDSHKDKALASDKRVWQEIQYLKLYKDTIKMMVDCTGLNEPVKETSTVSALDSLASQLEDYKEAEG